MSTVNVRVWLAVLGLLVASCVSAVPGASVPPVGVSAELSTFDSWGELQLFFVGAALREGQFLSYMGQAGVSDAVAGVEARDGQVGAVGFSGTNTQEQGVDELDWRVDRIGDRSGSRAGMRSGFVL